MVKSGEKWNRKWMVIRVNELGSASSCRVVAGMCRDVQRCVEMVELTYCPPLMMVMVEKL